MSIALVSTSEPEVDTTVDIAIPLSSQHANAAPDENSDRDGTSLGEVADSKRLSIVMDKPPALQESKSGTLDLERINVKKKRKDLPLTTGRMLPDGTYAMVVQPTGYTHRWCASLAEKARKRQVEEEAKRRALLRRRRAQPKGTHWIDGGSCGMKRTHPVYVGCG